MTLEERIDALAIHLFGEPQAFWAAEDEGYEDRSLAYQQAVQAVLAAQRSRLVQLRNEGVISNEVMNRVVREFDLEESRLEI